MFLNQPKNLYLLFFTELWERFGFMCLQTLFVLYLTHVFHYSDDHAYLLMGAFGAFQWLTPVPGGMMADRYLGFQRAIILGGVLLALGYLFTAFPTQTWFLIGLAILIIANGFFKPNVSSIVGTLYEKGDARRDSGFTLFYMGINIGTLLPPFFLGTLVKAYGYNSGFFVAALGMIISLVIFILGRKSLAEHGAKPSFHLLKTHSTKIRFVWIFALAIIAIGIFCYGALLIPAQSNIIMIIAAVIIILYLVTVTIKLDKKDRNNMLVCIILTVISIGFWSIYMQCFSSFMLFADRNLNLSMFGFKITPEFTQSYNSIFIIVLSPLFGLLWPALSKRKVNPSYPLKFALGTLFMALGLLILAAAIKYFSPTGYTNNWWLVFSYLLQTIGELVLSPIGLAMITALTPKKYVGMMMGIWFLAIAAAFAVGGELARIADVPKTATLLQSQHIYMHAFFDFGWLGIGLTVVAFLAIPKLKKMITH